MTEEVKIVQLNGELAAIEEKKADRDHKLAELAARKAKAKADLEESLKRNEDARQDAISPDGLSEERVVRRGSPRGHHDQAV